MTKFFIISLLALSLATTTAFSQSKNDTEFGFSIGYNSATVTAEGVTNTKHRTGFSAGFLVDHYFTDSWSIFGKLVYDQKGWANGYINTPTTTTYTDFHLDYLTIPVLADWHFGHTKNWYLNFGPYAAILLNASQTATDDDIKDFFNTVDAGLDLGIGVKFPVTDKTKFFIEVNGQGGASDLFKDNAGSAVHNNLSNVSIGFKF